MKTKEELFRIYSAYLPYKLMMFSSYNGEYYSEELTGIDKEGVFIEEIFEAGFKGYKPMLYPLSMLTKPIKHNGEKFVPIVRLSGYEQLKGEIHYGYSHKLFYVKLRIESSNEWVCHTVPSDLNSMNYYTV
jgi:hypothetical protein